MFRTQDQVAALSTMCTHVDGVHFTARYPEAMLAYLEASGFIAVTRPVHEPTGSPWGEDRWTVEVTTAGLELMNAWPEYQAHLLDG